MSRSGQAAKSAQPEKAAEEAQAPVRAVPAAPAAEPVHPGSLALVMDVPLDVTVELGRTRQRVREILDLAPGAVVELDRMAGEPVDVLVNGRLVAHGEVVVIDETFGVRITDIVAAEDRVGRVR